MLNQVRAIAEIIATQLDHNASNHFPACDHSEAQVQAHHTRLTTITTMNPTNPILLTRSAPARLTMRQLVLSEGYHKRKYAFTDVVSPSMLELSTVLKS